MILLNRLEMKIDLLQSMKENEWEACNHKSNEPANNQSKNELWNNFLSVRKCNLAKSSSRSSINPKMYIGIWYF